ncbi:MAG: ATP-dependent helicase [Pyrinomonadaceae bacterium MAG19_C2-C3]|nr:ATP-dependent helicase [Pyrinomonadaceae bacterium MAG19_C2-C3]
MKRYVIKRPINASAIDRLARYQEELNPEQFAVVTAAHAPALPSLVIAGAGTGKTRTITYRVAYLIEQGVSPSRILLATFTNRAAREMLRRVESLTASGDGNVSRKVWGGTFHRIGNLVLRRHAEALGYTSNYTILDAEDARDFLTACVAEAGVDTRARRFPKAEVLQDIASYATNTDEPIPDVVVHRYPQFHTIAGDIERVDRLYTARKRERNVMDYDDLLLNWKRLMIESDAVARLYQEQFQHILVDEYQDTNKLQAEIIDLLAVKHRGVTVVGDDSQSIFGWRGANVGNLFEFQKRYAEAALYKLETNYRSTPEILALANASIAHNRKQFPKSLRAVRASLDLKPALVPCQDAEQQAAFVVSRILELREEGTALEDIAVLYRSHYHSLEIQLELTRRNVPYQIRSGVRFFEQAHVKDVLSYLRIIANPFDEIAWKRALKLVPNIGAATANRVWETLRHTDDPLALVRRGAVDSQVNRRGNGWQIFRELLESLAGEDARANPARQIEIVLASGYEDYLAQTYENAEARLEDLRGLARYSARYDSTEEFLADLALLSTEGFGQPKTLGGEDVVSGADEDEMLVLTSVHQAKGLEWKAVFVVWAADGKFPSPRALREMEGEDEERRLWYVSITRAKDELYITYPLLAADYTKQMIVQRPSRFVTETLPELYDIWQLEEESIAIDEAAPEPLAIAEEASDFVN